MVTWTKFRSVALAQNIDQFLLEDGQHIISQLTQPFFKVGARKINGIRDQFTLGVGVAYLY